MKRRITATVFIALIFVLIFGVVAPFIASVAVYESCFDYRCTTSAEEMHYISDFPAMERERHSFATVGGNLVGYLYTSADGAAPRALIVFAHGMGRGGQAGYMDIFDIMVRRGYAVFAYDATANDESDGDVMGGLPQGIIDLDHAVNYATSLDRTSGLPLMLMGYSWGAMSVTAALGYHPETVAAVSLAGWNESMDQIEYRGSLAAGDAALMMLPFVRLYERMKYGDYADASAMASFEDSTARVMIVHGELDETVPIKYGLERYYGEYGGDERFTFKRYDDRAHHVFENDDGTLDEALFLEIADFFDASIGA